MQATHQLWTHKSSEVTGTNGFALERTKFPCSFGTASPSSLLFGQHQAKPTQTLNPKILHIINLDPALKPNHPCDDNGCSGCLASTTALADFICALMDEACSISQNHDSRLRHGEKHRVEAQTPSPISSNILKIKCWQFIIILVIGVR